MLASGDAIDETAIMLTGENLVENGSNRASPVPALGSAKASAGAPSPLVNPDITSAGVNTASAPVELVGKTVAEVEKQLIINTLEHCLGNRTHAATILGISIRTLRNKLKAYSDEGLSIPTTEELEEATT